MSSTFTFLFEIKKSLRVSLGFPGGSVVKNLPANAEDTGLIPDPGERNGSPLQYSCLENPMDRGAWRATVHGVTKRWTWLRNWTTIAGFTAGRFPVSDSQSYHLRLIFLRKGIEQAFSLLLENSKYLWFSHWRGCCLVVTWLMRQAHPCWDEMCC